jgi:hypothetical protein
MSLLTPNEKVTELQPQTSNSQVETNDTAKDKTDIDKDDNNGNA